MKKTSSQITTPLSVKKTVRRGMLSATLTQLLTGTHKGSWKITYKDAKGRTSTGGVIKTEAKAKKRAEQILDGLLATDIRDLSPAESQLIQKLRTSQITPATLDTTLAELRTVQTMITTDATKIFLEREIDGEGYSYQQSKDYHRVLTELQNTFGTQPIAAITLHQLEAWADKWKVGPKRFNNKRTILSSFFKWCLARNYAVKNIAEQLPRKRLPRKKDHTVYTPKEFAKLLTHCPEAYLPWLALSGFAGLRGVEIYGRPDDRHSGLRWENIDRKRKLIILAHHSAKQTRSSRTRLIPITDALLDWLSPWANSSGPVYPPTMGLPYETTNSISNQLGEHIGGWQPNALRASRASYRLAETQSIATVTLEMGHSKDMLLGTYLNPRFEEDAATWFSLDRAAAKELASQPETISIAS